MLDVVVVIFQRKAFWGLFLHLKCNTRNTDTREICSLLYCLVKRAARIASPCIKALLGVRLQKGTSSGLSKVIEVLTQILELTNS